MLLQHGAESQRVEETTIRIGRALGSDVMDVFVAANALQITTMSGGEFRTRVARVAHHGVDMTIVSAINRLSRRIEAGELDRAQVRAELERISTLSPHYNRWLVVGMVGLACAAFSRLFGADWPAFAITFLSSSVAMIARQELARRSFNVLITTVVAAFVAGVLASSATWLHMSIHPELALAASVLFLVPGVPLINAVQDMVKGHPNIGLARATTGMLIVLAIALGLVVAIRITGVQGL